MEFVLQLGLGAFAAGADGFGVVAVVCSGWFGVVAVGEKREVNWER